MMGRVRKSDVPVHLHTAIRTYYLLSEIKGIRQLYMDRLNNAHYQKSPCVMENQLVTFISSNVVGGSLSTLCHTTFGIALSLLFFRAIQIHLLTYLLTCIWSLKTDHLQQDFQTT